MMKIVKGKISCAQKCVIYGVEGIGKSTFASKFPKPLFIDLEEGTNSMDVDRVASPKSWSELSMILNEFKNDPQGYQTLVIDTADRAEFLCMNFICAQRNVRTIGDIAYGKGYEVLGQEFGKFLNCLSDIVMKSNVHVVVCAHAKMRKFEQPDESGAYDRWELKMSKGCAPLLKEWADALLFVNYKTFAVRDENDKIKAKGGKRVMFAQHKPCWDAKNRWGLSEECEFDFATVAPYISSNFVARKQEVIKSAADAKKEEYKAELDNLVENAVDAPPTMPAEKMSTMPTSPTARDDEPPQATYETHEKPPEPVAAKKEIPDALLRLMESSGVTEHDIQVAVSNNGYYPADMPVADYDINFINGKLIAGWDKFYNAVLYYKQLPFSGENK